MCHKAAVLFQTSVSIWKSIFCRLLLHLVIHMMRDHIGLVCNALVRCRLDKAVRRLAKTSPDKVSDVCHLATTKCELRVAS